MAVTEGTVAVSVTSPKGSSTTSSASTFTYPAADTTIAMASTMMHRRPPGHPRRQGDNVEAGLVPVDHLLIPMHSQGVRLGLQLTRLTLGHNQLKTLDSAPAPFTPLGPKDKSVVRFRARKTPPRGRVALAKRGGEPNKVPSRETIGSRTPTEPKAGI